MLKAAGRLFAPLFVAASLVLAATAPAGAAPPKAWATKVCTGVGQWTKAVEKRADQATRKVTRRATPSRKSLLKMLNGAKFDTNKLVAKLRRAGTPSGSGGKKVAKTTREAYSQIGRTLAQTAKAIKKLKPKQLAKFIEQSRLAQDGFENGLERVEGIFASTTAFDKPKLLAGFAGAKSCAKSSKTTTAASATPGPQGEVSIASVTPASGPTGTRASYEFANVNAEGRDLCANSSAYRVELLGPDGAQLGFGGDTVEIPADAPEGVSSIRIVCYFPGRFVRPSMRSLCGEFEVIAPGATAGGGGSGAPCPPTGRVLNGEAVIAAQRAIGEGFNVLVGTIYGP
jgi:hypothetical protein